MENRTQKILQHSAAFLSAFRPRRRPENRAQNVAFKHHIRSICRYWHCNTLHFGNKSSGLRTVPAVISNGSL